MSDEAAARAAIARIRDACAELADADDDAVRMYAVRVEALSRALLDSVLGDGDERA
jgi:hypothetical protein